MHVEYHDSDFSAPTIYVSFNLGLTTIEWCVSINSNYNTDFLTRWKSIRDSLNTGWKSAEIRGGPNQDWSCVAIDFKLTLQYNVESQNGDMSFLINFTASEIIPLVDKLINIYDCACENVQYLDNRNVVYH